MHFKKEINLLDFLTAVKKCSGNVFFETKEGDCLALRSALSQYIFCAAANEEELLRSGTVRCDSPADYTVLKAFLQK